MHVYFIANGVFQFWLSDLAQRGYFKDSTFINYLKYLNYWKEPQYARFLKYVYLAGHIPMFDMCTHDDACCIVYLQIPAVSAHPWAAAVRALSCGVDELSVRKVHWRPTDPALATLPAQTSATARRRSEVCAREGREASRRCNCVARWRLVSESDREKLEAYSNTNLIRVYLVTFLSFSKLTVLITL